MLDGGQVCNAAESVYLQRGIADRLAERVTRLMAETRCGNPLTDADLHLGPINNQGGCDKISALVSWSAGQLVSWPTGPASTMSRRCWWTVPTRWTG